MKMAIFFLLFALRVEADRETCGIEVLQEEYIRASLPIDKWVESDKFWGLMRVKTTFYARKEMRRYYSLQKVTTAEDLSSEAIAFLFPRMKQVLEKADKKRSLHPLLETVARNAVINRRRHHWRYWKSQESVSDSQKLAILKRGETARKDIHLSNIIWESWQEFRSFNLKQEDAYIFELFYFKNYSVQKIRKVIGEWRREKDPRATDPAQAIVNSKLNKMMEKFRDHMKEWHDISDVDDVISDQTQSLETIDDIRH